MGYSTEKVPAAWAIFTDITSRGSYEKSSTRRTFFANIANRGRQQLVEQKTFKALSFFGNIANRGLHEKSSTIHEKKADIVNRGFGYFDTHSKELLKGRHFLRI